MSDVSQHGRWAYLKHKCRCEICVAAEDEYQASRRRTITCPTCGKTAEVKRRTRYCSKSCATTAGNKATPRGIATRGVQPAKLVRCAWCDALHAGKGKACSDECRKAAAARRARAARSPLRAALQDYDIGMVKAELLKRVTIVGDCWYWPNLDADGYPQLHSRDRSLHRQVLAAKHGAPLGTQAAHHMCAHASCVNPDHLQPVTHRENVAEMLARRSYLARIAELEAALASVAPNHPVLTVIAVA